MLINNPELGHWGMNHITKKWFISALHVPPSSCSFWRSRRSWIARSQRLPFSHAEMAEEYLGPLSKFGNSISIKDEPSLLDIFIVRLIVIALSWDTLSISWDVHLFSGTHHRPVESRATKKLHPGDMITSPCSFCPCSWCNSFKACNHWPAFSHALMHAL